MKPQNTHPSHNTEINPQPPADAEPPQQDIPVIGNIKGTGDILFGKGNFAADGSYIAIRWFGVFHIPLIPLSGYFVTAATRGGVNNQYIINQYEGVNVAIPKSQLWFIALHFLLLLTFLCALFYLPADSVRKAVPLCICAYGLLILIKRASEKIALDHARKHNIRRDIKTLLP